MQTVRAPRFQTDRPVIVTRYWEDMPVRRVAGRCQVLNQNGLGAKISDELYIGEVVRLELPPARGVYASVRNSRGNHYGLQFLCLSDSQDRAINRLCEACAIEQMDKQPSQPEARPWR